MSPIFTPGNNIAIKTPSHEYQQSIAFYRDVLGLVPITIANQDPHESQAFSFGDKILWIDKIDHLSQAEIWLEVLADDLEAAARHFELLGIARRDAIEPLPDSVPGFWIAGPSNIIHLVTTGKSVNK